MEDVKEIKWNYEQPVKILFGKGRISEIGAVARNIGVKKGLLVTSRFFVKDGTSEKILKESGGILSVVYGNVSPNPDVSEVDECAELLRSSGAEFVVAVGGGSVIDCAKAAAGVALTGNSISRYHGTGIQLPPEHIPLIAVPTTAGTGSEVTCVSVLTDHRKGIKAPVVSNGFYPRYAVLDPVLTYSMPQKIAASSGIDVLSHALEAFWSRGHQPICDAMALHAGELVFTYLRRSCADSGDHEAKDKMCEASLFAGLAFTLPKTTSSHACSFPLTNKYNIPHGEACGLTLDYFTRINAEGPEGKRIDDFAERLGFGSASDMADHIHTLKSSIGVRNDIRDLHLTEEDIAELVTASHHPNLLNNPVEITDELLSDMYHKLV